MKPVSTCTYYALPIIALYVFMYYSKMYKCLLPTACCGRVVVIGFYVPPTCGYSADIDF